MTARKYRFSSLLVVLITSLSNVLAFQFPATSPASLSRAQSSNATSSHALSAPQGVAPVGIASCQSITSPGDYILKQDMTSQGSCILISAVNNVNLECSGHAIFSTSSAPNISITNSTNVTISGCTAHKSQENGNALAISGSSFVNVANNDLEGVIVQNTANVQVLSNHILGAYYQNPATAAIVENNDIVGFQDQGGCGGICSVGGDHNRFIANHIDGKWNGQLPSGGQGADDGVVINAEHDDVVYGNVIQNVFDAGVETVGLVPNTTIQNNQIQNAGVAGVSSYYDTGWSGNIVSGNQVMNAPVFLYVDFNFHPGDPNPSAILFQNNRIENNVFTSPWPFTGTNRYNNSMVIVLVDPGTGLSVVPVVAGNNVITNNLLPTYQPGPELLPSYAFADGGGNHCGSPYIGSPVSCNGAPAQFQAPMITNTGVPGAEIGIAYSYRLSASGGAPPYNGWTVVSGALPAGLTLSVSTGVVSGIPTGTAAFPYTPYFFEVAVKDSTNQISAAQPLEVTVSPGGTPQWIIFGTLNDQTFGAAPFQLSATASSGLAVMFTSNTTQVCTVAGVNVTLVAVGTCSITASLPAASVTRTFTVDPASQTITFGRLARLSFGTPPFSLAATASSGLPVTFASNTPTVCTVSSSTVTIIAVGTCAITVSQAGNTNYLPAVNVTQTLAVNPSQPAIPVAALPADFSDGLLSPEYYTDTRVQPPPSGVAAFQPMSPLGITTATSGSVQNTGPTFAAPGGYPWALRDTTRNVVILHPCAGSCSPATGADFAFCSPYNLTYRVSGTFARANTSIGAGVGVQGAVFLNDQLANPLFLGTVGPNNAVDPSNYFGGSGAAAFNLTTSLNQNDCLRFAVFAKPGARDGTFDATAVGFTITNITQTIVFGALSNHTFGTAPFPLSAAASSGLAVTFASSTTSVCTVSGSDVTLVSPGTCSITASQAGSADYGAAPPVTQSFTVALASAAPLITSNGIVPVYSSVTTIQPGEWISIYGTNLASSLVVWDGTVQANGSYPTSLGNVSSITFNGIPGYLWFVTPSQPGVPSQINVQVPSGLPTSGTVTVVVNNSNGSATSSATLGVVAPSLSLLDNKHVAAWIYVGPGKGHYYDVYDLVGAAGTFAGLTTRPVKAGESLVLYGVGFGPTLTAVAAGKQYTGATPTTNPVTVSIGGVNVTPVFAGLVGTGLYQINVIVPNVPGGEQPVIASVDVGGANFSTPAGFMVSIQ